MTPKEKANELIEDFAEIIPHIEYGVLMERNWKTAKQCALIAVDEIIQQNNIWIAHVGKGTNNFWKEVKEEINNL